VQIAEKRGDSEQLVRNIRVKQRKKEISEKLKIMASKDQITLQ
jgi:hypothetical protein